MKLLSNLLFWCVFMAMANLPLGCTSQKVALDTFTGNKLVWGKGGGVTGKVTEFVLLPNGQVFQREPLSQKSTELASISGKEAAQLFKQASQVNLAFKRPGNMYQYIKLEEGTATGQEAVWGDHQFTPPAEVEALYRQLQALVRQ